jgi:hypothetical protein
MVGVTRDPEEHWVFARRRTRSSIPNDCPLLLLSRDSAIRGRRGKPRLYGKFGMKNAAENLG